MTKQIHHPLQSDEKHVEEVRKTIREARAALELPLPDTFLGRQTHEPFPSENDDDAQDRQRHTPA
ncbi:MULTISPECIES: hypothetical protein [Bradyrhizobium]|uniref:hypothetical protein n=1 Tax=Bradyrhizobium TaxID=374 RepID=UPI0004B9F1C3|nr:MULTISPECIES: hypothetical protein [Bradyrhizobium]MCA1385889.1 hypothetical protein [Bradyrhizobium sp. BRP05]MCA1418453.1 hypothetical protein [Bradyrhizobium sp. BRP23]MCA1506037.1 hypothetical protein [Bradyrhizobium sp. NBAIM02]MCA1528391.1 hypothetical protein [Bradyrhizobium yuanmingense]